MAQNEIIEEIKICQENPYYFATKYLTVKDNKGNTIPYTTSLSEKEFNDLYNKIKLCK